MTNCLVYEFISCTVSPPMFIKLKQRDRKTANNSKKNKNKIENSDENTIQSVKQQHTIV